MSRTELRRLIEEKEAELSENAYINFDITMLARINNEGFYEGYSCRCATCGEVWDVTRVDGDYPEEFWKCPNGCNKDILKDPRANHNV